MMCAVVASANASVVGAPADTIKTRSMNEKDPAKQKAYWALAKRIIEKEGIRAFFKGLDAVFFRLSCWNTIMFITLEKIKLYYYDPTLD